MCISEAYSSPWTRSTVTWTSSLVRPKKYSCPQPRNFYGLPRRRSSPRSRSRFSTFVTPRRAWGVRGCTMPLQLSSIRRSTPRSGKGWRQPGKPGSRRDVVRSMKRWLTEDPHQRRSAEDVSHQRQRGTAALGRQICTRSMDWTECCSDLYNPTGDRFEQMLTAALLDHLLWEELQPTIQSEGRPRVCTTSQRWCSNVTWKRQQCIGKYGKLSNGLVNGRNHIPIINKENIRQCQNYRTINLISHSSNVMLKVMKTRLTLVVKQLLAEEHAGFSFNKVSAIEVPSCPHHAVRRNAHRVGATDPGIQNKAFQKTSSDLLRRTQNKWSHPLRSLHLGGSPGTPSYCHQKAEADVVQGCRSTRHILKTVLQGYVTTGQVKEELAAECERVDWLPTRGHSNKPSPLICFIVSPTTSGTGERACFESGQ